MHKRKRGIIIQTVGTLTTLAGLVVAVLAGVLYSSNSPPSIDWVADFAAICAGLLVAVGLVASITGRVIGDGPV